MSTSSKTDLVAFAREAEVRCATAGAGFITSCTVHIMELVAASFLPQTRAVLLKAVQAFTTLP